MVTLYNVIDTRNGWFYSVVKVNEKYAKYFVPKEEGIE